MSVEADYVYTGEPRDARHAQREPGLRPGDRASTIRSPTSRKRPYPQWGDVSVRRTIGESNYHGLQMAFTKRMSNRWQASATYLLAGQWNLQNAPGAGAGCENPTTLIAVGRADVRRAGHAPPGAGGGVVPHRRSAAPLHLQRHLADRRRLPGERSLLLRRPGLGDAELRCGRAPQRQHRRPGSRERHASSRATASTSRRCTAWTCALQRQFRLGDKVAVDGIVEVFNLFNHANYASFTTNETQRALRTADREPERLVSSRGCCSSGSARRSETTAVHNPRSGSGSPVSVPTRGPSIVERPVEWRTGRQLEHLSCATDDGLRSRIVSLADPLCVIGRRGACRGTGRPAGRFHLVEATIADVHRAIRSGRSRAAAWCRPTSTARRRITALLISSSPATATPIPPAPGVVRAGAPLTFPTGHRQGRRRCFPISTSTPDRRSTSAAWSRLRPTRRVQQQFGMIVGVPNAGSAGGALHDQHPRRALGDLQGRVRQGTLGRARCRLALRPCARSFASSRTRSSARRSSTRNTATRPI